MSSESPITQIIKRNGTTVRYDRRRISTAILKALTSEGRSEAPLADAMASQVEKALISTYNGQGTPSVEDIQDVVEKVLMENRLTQVAKSYIIYRHQRAVARAARADVFEVSDNIPYRILYEVLRWNIAHQCDTVHGINRLLARGDFPQLITDTDKRYADEITRAAETILGALPRVRIAIVAGPSSSGKTTTTLKLSEALNQAGVGLKAINIDHYFFDLVKHPKDEFGDYDYETPAALDLDLINEHLMQLLDGASIRTPHYDFKTGVRTLDVHEMRLEKDEILLIDSLHGLYDRMTSSVPDDRKFTLYIETLGQLRADDGNFMRWADNRLLRRMVRDKDQRNLKPIETLTHWHYVRRSELRHIIPFIKHADCVVNSALPYELPILKARIFRYVSSSVRTYTHDPKRLDAHIRVNRVYDLLKPLKAVRDDGAVPADSLLREFIGGSRYAY